MKGSEWLFGKSGTHGNGWHCRLQIAAGRGAAGGARAAPGLPNGL